jgi:thiol peroxidase
MNRESLDALLARAQLPISGEEYERFLRMSDLVDKHVAQLRFEEVRSAEPADARVDARVLHPAERPGAAFELGEQLTVVGRQLRPGDIAPQFALETLDPASGSVHTVRLADTAGQVRLLNVVNSLDTPVCDVETRRWEALRTDLATDVQVYTISMDLPFAQARWCNAAAVQHQALSAHKDDAFGRAYGVLIKEWRLLQRAVFVIDHSDRVAHVEYVADQMTEPDYAAAVNQVASSTRANASR